MCVCVGGGVCVCVCVCMCVCMWKWGGVGEPEIEIRGRESKNEGRREEWGAKRERYREKQSGIKSASHISDVRRLRQLDSNSGVKLIHKNVESIRVRQRVRVI